MDIRNELDKFLVKWGQNVFLQRVINPFNNDEECPKYERILEKHTVRSMNVLASRFLADAKQEQTEGIEFPAEMVFWFRWDVNPVSMDRVIVNSARHPNSQCTYEIDFADAKYGVGGRIEFWAVGATRIQPE